MVCKKQENKNMKNETKKIVFFTPSLNIGGIEKVFITYANQMCNNDDYEIS